MQEEFNSIVVKLAKDFINLPIDKIEEAIHNAMKMIGGYCGADRITIYLYDWKNEFIYLRNEWARNEKYLIQDKYKIVQFSQMTPHILKKHLAGRPHTASINNNAQNLNYVTDVIKTGAFVSTSIPLIAEGDVLGSCVLSRMEENTEWPDLVISSITIFCEMLASVLQRIKTNRELVENNVSMRLLLDSTNDGIALLDTSGTILNVNKSFASRFEAIPEQMTGKYWLSFTPEVKYKDLRQARVRLFEKAIKTGQPVAFEDCRDGLTFYNRYYPVLKNGKVSSVALFSTDITDKTRAIEQAKKSAEYQTRMRIQTEFFANISHEFKTPLSIILAELELMNLNKKDEEKLNKYIKAAKQNTYRLTRLVGNLLDLMKLDAGYLKTDLRYTDIVPILKEITDSAIDYASAKSISLQFETKLLGYYMAVDQYKTERIMLNLLSNAIKFTQKGGHIRVTVKGRENGIQIIVSDNGEGIPKEKLGLVFDRFIQADPSLSRKAEGSGIGLSLTKSLVELLKGRIWAKSIPGKGSVFFVELPLQELADKSKFVEVNGYSMQERVEFEFSDIYFEH
jgi:PAS domain S-box